MKYPIVPVTGNQIVSALQVKCCLAVKNYNYLNKLATQKTTNQGVLRTRRQFYSNIILIAVIEFLSIQMSSKST